MMHLFKTIDKKRVRFYGWTALGLILLGSIHDGGNKDQGWAVALLNNSWLGVFVAVMNMAFLEYTWPRIRWRTAFTSLLLIVGHIFLYSCGLYLWRGLGVALHIYTPYGVYESVGKNIADRMGYSMGSLVFFALIRHIYLYNLLKSTAQQLRIEKQAAELSWLRAQTNPHFLFNTLNNIYSLARDKDDLAPESILRLSKILRYMLYETSGPWVTIEQEIKITTDYIALERLRYDDSLRVTFSHDIEDKGQALPPLLLLPLVENAFKHGVAETRVDPFVSIHLSLNQRILVFLVRNSTGVGAPEGGVRENIGLSNLRRQLELLYTDYSLNADWKGAEFTAELRINLASHV